MRSEFSANLFLAKAVKAVKVIIIDAQSTKADVQAFARECGKKEAAKACAKAGIPCEIAKSWIL